MADLTKVLMVVAALFAWSVPAGAADAPELRVEHSIIIDAPPEAVWAVAGDFNGIPRWLPSIAHSRMVLGANNQVGSIRELTRQNGTRVQERLLEYETGEPKTLTYTYVGGEVIASDYFATMVVSDTGNGRTQVVWKARFKRLAYWTDDPPPGQDDAHTLNLLNKAYPLGLQTLKKVVETGD